MGPCSPYLVPTLNVESNSSLSLQKKPYIQKYISLAAFWSFPFPDKISPVPSIFLPKSDFQHLLKMLLVPGVAHSTLDAPPAVSKEEQAAPGCTPGLPLTGHQLDLMGNGEGLPGWSED